jgi:hypothetical protein
MVRKNHLGDDPRRLQRSERVDATHPGHRDVRGDDDPGWRRTAASTRLRPSLTVPDDVTCSPQQTDQFLHDQSVIVGDQDSGASACFSDDFVSCDVLAGSA